MGPATGRQFLLIDGDDTLWENNVYFEQAIEAFIDFLGHSSMTREQVRTALDEVEHMNVGVHGYGSAAFTKNLQQTYARLAERDGRPEDIAHVMQLGQRIASQPLTLIPEVAETIDYLAGRHDLLLVTKGHPEEQRLKIERSGLESRFTATVVVPEKAVDTYRAIARERKLDPTRTWMIGNSPRSDINPALQAGLNAVFIPHEHTWRLEKEEVTPGDGRLLILRGFGELRAHF
ncbi:MAG TPA: HAD family hydrolase [Candidatus Dormibacteraeota bacterium]|jgi:putative hydrolase of the HAD superfamily|nr:HAD family hydrolase [Candidatus Dormibacteraeota bacterium]